MSSRSSNLEEERRRNEINMFAAMALGEEWEAPSVLGGDFISNDDVAPSPINFDPATSTSYHGLSPDADQFLSFNQDSSLSLSLSSFGSSGSIRQRNTANESSLLDDALTAPKFSGSRSSSPIPPQLPFQSQLQQRIDSGSFAFDSQKPVTAMEKSNLDAALAALEKDSLSQPPDKYFSRPLLSPKSYFARNPAKGSVPVSRPNSLPEQTAPMFAEHVLMPRPLFFGSLVSPRVVRQARQAVLDALASRMDATQGVAPCMEDLPGSVRNLIGALRVYGYGIDVLQNLKESTEEDDCLWKGDPYVSTYQPLWGEAERAERIKDMKQTQQKREKKRNQNRPSLVSRSSTAPGRLFFDDPASILVMDLEEDDVEDLSVIHESKSDPRDSISSPLRDGSVGTAAGEWTSELFTSDGSSPFEFLTRDPSYKFGSTSHQRDNALSGSPSNSNAKAANSNSGQITSNELFSAWIRAGDDEHAINSPGIVSPLDGGSTKGKISAWGSRLSNDSPPSPPRLRASSEDSLESEGDARGDNDDSNNNNKQTLSERELFSQWARGETEPPGSPGRTNSKKQLSSNSIFVADPARSGTFLARPTMRRAESDDHSVEHDECKKQVGLNEHLSKALAFFSDNSEGPPQIEVDESQVLLSQVPTNGLGRPLTNYELTSGCFPVFGADDPPLPVEGDLGVHETKEEQQKYQESKRAQDIVEKFVKPNIFGPVSCPNPALGPDDFHSWNARVVGNQRLAPLASGAEEQFPGSSQNASQQNPQVQQGQQSPQSKPNQVQQSPQSQKQPDYGESLQIEGSVKLQNQGQTFRGISDSSPPSTDQGKPPRSSKKTSKRKLLSRTRYGWWNVGDIEDWPATVPKPGEVNSKPVVPNDPEDEVPRKLHFPPQHHSAKALQVVTQLHPTPGVLQKENLPLSRMHAATSMAQSLPYLSDRPHSYRYLQIDSQAVAFPPIGGEAEPLFCSLAIYNMETITSGPSNSELNSSPLPDLQRCGRITEFLNFDIFSEPEVGIRCESVLWPYEPSSPFARILNTPDKGEIDDRARRRIATRCGVFPLPSNLNFANLYAVLIVKKVMMEDSLDLYLKPGPYKAGELDKLRLAAEKASRRQSAFLLPFAFGIAPLLQVFGGSDSPVVTSSRSVQIPLFRFSPGQGDRQIIDHVMVMLSPRDQRASMVGTGTPVAGTNGGTAKLVMRNFGYLGLHQVVDKSSILAKERLVDFSGELQLRQNKRFDSEKAIGMPTKDGCSLVLPDWKPDFIAEPTEEGGRCVEDGKESGSPNTSSQYAQELSPVRLQLGPSLRMAPPVQQGVSRGRVGGLDIEPTYHTCFCNEMLFQPRLLHNCPKGNIAIKAELREVEWNETLSAYIAHLPRCGPSLHNNRRGPFLVQSVLTSCSPRGCDKHFIDEFKLKLPLDLQPGPKGRSNRTYCLLFTVYQIKIGSRSRWKLAKKIFSGSDANGGDSHGPSRVEPIASGFFPISRNGGCLVDDGIHDVRITYLAQSPTLHLLESGSADKSSLVLVDRVDSVDIGSFRDASFAEDVTVSNGSGAAISDESMTSSIDFASSVDDSASRSERGKATNEPISLSVRICVNSSLHPQNAILCDYLHEEDDSQRASDLNRNGFLTKISLGKEIFTRESRTRKYSEQEERLLRSTLDVVKYNVCPVTKTHAFLFRVMTKLWRTLIMGTGEASLAWANPATPIPLRLHAFASILQLLGGSSLYSAKNGVTQTDGTSKWSIVSLGRVIALFFDEQKLFGDSATEFFHHSFLRPSNPNDRSPGKRLSSGRRKRHVRNGNFELFGTRSYQSSPESPGNLSPVTPGGSGPGHNRRLSDLQRRQNEDQSKPDITNNIFVPKPHLKKEFKVDSKSDFQSALRAATAAENDFDRPESDGNRNAKAMIQALSSGQNTGSRRWMTAPSRSLATITELDDTDTEEISFATAAKEETTEVVRPATPPRSDDLDSEIMLQPKSEPRKTKQMRIPKSRKSSSSFDFGAILEEAAPSEATSQASGGSFETGFKKPQSVPKSDDEIESAGTAFLDVIGKSIGISSASRGMATEEQRVGSSHHRKTLSKSSIDWTLIGIEDGFAPAIIEEHDEQPRDFSNDENEGLATLRNEEKKCVALPGFADRLVSLEQHSAHSARWFPFAYEVIIIQWSVILVEQRALGERVRPDRSRTTDRSGESSDEQLSVEASIVDSATRSIGVAVAGAPLLFEVIKESLGFRIASLFRKGIEIGSKWTSPPLVVLDENLFSALEQVISMIADACIDSRNFDSWELRQMSIDVNDSIIRFLRDIFSFLCPKSVHHLILSYLSRFVTKEGKHWQDRDSSIGLRCSWEIAKLRLNAITALVRFPDFVRVNGPQMLNWSDWWSPSPSYPNSFFEDTLERYKGYRLPAFAGSEMSTNQSKFEIPSMHPHWLSEIVVDVCLLGTEHAEPQIQQRSAALLHELFWSCSQEGVLTGQSAPIASMFIGFVWKVLSRYDYLSNFAPKSQLRKDLIPCVVFVLQSAPNSLLRALWRKLCMGLKSKSSSDRYGGFSSGRTRTFSIEQPPKMRAPADVGDPDVLDMFSVLNLSLRTLEYEGSEEHLEKEGVGASRENLQLWKKEFLPSDAQFSAPDAFSRKKVEDNDNLKSSDPDASSTVSRRWSGHDGALVLVNAGHEMVWELYRILSGVPEGELLLNPAIRRKMPVKCSKTQKLPPFSHGDIAVFVRAASSLYLHALALRQSDIVIVRTFKVSAELIKIFGIKTFLEGLGETLQHWMRVILLMCGARRAYVRIEATDLLELILRSTWQLYGSFFRIRVPLLAVQTEVMERIVQTAAARYYRDQRRLQSPYEPFSDVYGEASLVPLWRTLDRIEKQPASQNIAFRGALVRMAEKMKKLYRAYVAARVLSFIQGSFGNVVCDEDLEEARDLAKEAILRAKRISVLRVINASEGHTKQFLGFRATTQQRSRVAHFEAVEDALMDAADVFSPTELPEHRVAWLRMLADFHAYRRKFAEEATCHFYIHVTLHQASKLHGYLWSNTPFLPWTTDNIPDPVYIDVDGGQTDPDYGSEFDFENQGSMYGRPVSSFRRIFYRVANSVALNTNEWDTAGNQTLFCGIASSSEYNSVSPWVTLRDMEDQMVEEAEQSGDLFLRAGIIESSRFSWNLATQFYAQKFNFAKLAMSYRNLERAVVSKVPPIDANLPQEFTAVLGRFYRVWFHGGAPDELSGVEFIYRAEGGARLDTFGQELKDVIKSIIPDNTPIHLVLDGRNEERIEEGAAGLSFNRLGPTPLEPVRIKVTPLRPLFDTNNRIRGLPEWFYQYADEAFETLHHRSKSELGRAHSRKKGSPSYASDSSYPHHREHGRTYSASISSSTGSLSGNNLSRRVVDDRGPRFGSIDDDELSGVDKFCFVQPKDRSRSRDWWKNTATSFADKTLKVTQLQVAQSFPACVTRQPVVHRLVYSQSPLEAGIDVVCQWCAVLFRTAVATVGMAVLGTNLEEDPTIGKDAVKVVADCIHSSHVKETGLALMKKESDCQEGDSRNVATLESYDRLSDDEIRKLQVKLARLIVVFIELLHHLICRNRQILLEFMEQRKRSEINASVSSGIRPTGRLPPVGPPEQNSRWTRFQRGESSESLENPSVPPAGAPRSATTLTDSRKHQREPSLTDYVNNNRRLNQQSSATEDFHSFSSVNMGANSGRPGESAIAVQGELQRAFINMVKSLYPKLQGILQMDTPRWLKFCSQDTYFSLGTYKQTKLFIEEELCYTPESLSPPTPRMRGDSQQGYDGAAVGGSSLQSLQSPRGSINGGSSQSVVSRGSDRYLLPGSMNTS